MITHIGTGLVVLSAVLAWAFCLLYHFTAPWRASAAGRHIMTFTATLAVVLTLWSVGALTPATKGTWWEITRLVAFGGIPLMLARRIHLLWRLQIRRKEQQ